MGVAMLSDWQQTVLWQRIVNYQGAEEDRKKVMLCLEAWMPDVQAVLDQGGVLEDFTLHDSQHGFRVAQRMAEIVPPGTNLSVYELGLLLLSAYLHDSGMVPRRDLVKVLRCCLHKGADDALTELQAACTAGDLLDTSGENLSSLQDELKRFTSWLKSFDPPVRPPLKDPIKGCSGTEDSYDFLIGHYCRSRHTEWSAAFIARQVTIDPHSRWRADLVELCKSHHWGRDKLNTLGCYRVSPGQMVNIRYLAVILRVADVMDVTPERVPTVLYDHRAVSSLSRIYWLKDSTVWLTIDDRSPLYGNEGMDRSAELASPGIRFEGRPSDGRCEFALNETADQIDFELSQARTLAEEDWFADGGRGESLRCRWDLPHRVHRRIKSRDDQYVYIDGRFRPDTHKVLEILSGHNLYENELAAVRELVQNAYDAVRWCIAEDMLKELARDKRPKEEKCTEQELIKLRERVCARYHVELEVVRKDDGRWWLVCRDNGVGMNRAIIERRFLISGGGDRRADVELEDRCREMNFSAEITGQFGIGVLSYFMLADRFEIRTLRRRDKDGCAWQFISDGLESFGELKSISPDALDEHGTELSLRLRPDILGEGAEHWTERLSTYLGEKLIFAPCHTLLTLGAETKLDAPAGWVRNEGYYKKVVLAPLDDMIAQTIKDGLITAEREVELYFEREKLEQLRTQIEGALSFAIKDGLLTGEGGRWRVLLPVFKQPDNTRSLVYRIEGSRVIAGRQLQITAWKGMAADHRKRENRFFEDDSDAAPAIVEIDFQSSKNATLSVNRNNLTLKGEWLNLADPAIAGSAQLLEDHLSENAQSPWSLIDSCFARGASEHPLPPLGNRLWPVVKPGTRKVHYIPPSFPAVQFDMNTTLIWCGKPVTKIRSVLAAITARSLSGFVFPFTSDRIALAREKNSFALKILQLWSEMPDERAQQELGTNFPPEWADIVAVRSEGAISLNKNHPLVRKVTPKAWAWAQSLDDVFDIQAFESELSDSTHAAAWLLSAIVLFEFDKFQALTERQQAIVTNIWQNTVGPQELYIMGQKYSVSTEVAVIPAPPFANWGRKYQAELPKGEEWYLQLVETENAEEKS